MGQQSKITEWLRLLSLLVHLQDPPLVKVLAPALLARH